MSKQTTSVNAWSEQATAVCELGRLKFLSYSPMMYTIGAVIAVFYDADQTSSLNLHAYFVGWLCMSMVHAMTHYFNEWRDFDTDSVNQTVSPWTGGSQVLVKGKLSLRTALLCGLILVFFICLLSTYMFYIFNNFVAAFIAIAGVVFSIQYSLPPIAASRHCLGELWVALVLNIMLPLFGYALQRYSDVSNIQAADGLQKLTLTEVTGPPAVFWWVLLPIAVVEYFRMLVMNMSDIVADAQVGKITLAVWLGHEVSAVVHNVGMTAAYALLAAVVLVFDQDGQVPVTVVVLLLLTSPFCLYYSQLLHVRPLMYEMPYYATQHNAACMLSVYFGLLLPRLVQNWERLVIDPKPLGLLLPVCIILGSLKPLFDNTRRGTKQLVAKIFSGNARNVLVRKNPAETGQIEKETIL